MASNEIKIKSGVLSKAGGILALISLLFLPLGGCEGITLTGIDALKYSDVSQTIKVMLIFSMACAVLTFAVKSAEAYFTTGGVGVGSLLLAYMIARQDVPVDLKAGGYLAILGFGLVLIEGLMTNNSLLDSEPGEANLAKNSSSSADFDPGSIANLSLQEKYNNGYCPNCLVVIANTAVRCPGCQENLFEYAQRAYESQ